MKKKEQKDAEFDRLTRVEIARRVNNIQENLNELKLFLAGMGVPIEEEA